jgi:hypothetical protein
MLGMTMRMTWDFDAFIIIIHVGSFTSGCRYSNSVAIFHRLATWLAVEYVKYNIANIVIPLPLVYNILAGMLECTQQRNMLEIHHPTSPPLRYNMHRDSIWPHDAIGHLLNFPPNSTPPPQRDLGY